MASRSEQTKRDWERQILSRKQIQLLSPMRIEYLDGDNSSSQTFRLKQHAEFIFAVYELYDGTNLLTPMSGRVLKEVAALSAETRGYTLTEGNLITFGDATNGYKPPDSSSNKPGLMVVYRGASEYSEETTLTWTNDDVGDDNVPETDTAVYVKGSPEVGLFFNTTGPVGGSTFDLKIIMSVDDGTTYSETDSLQPFTAQAITKKYPNAINGASYDKIKARMDVIGANMGSGKSCTLKIQPVWRY